MPHDLKVQAFRLVFGDKQHKTLPLTMIKVDKASLS